MTLFPASLIGALAASTVLAWSGAALAGPAAEDAAAMGAGYTALDAPLGSPTELRIDIHGRVAARCELVSPPALTSRLDLARPGQARADFTIDCNTPFTLRVRSGEGGFAGMEPTIGAASLVPYEMSLDVGTDTGVRPLGWCRSEQLTETGSSGCVFGGAGQGWSSGEDTAIGRKGTMHLRWREQQQDAPAFGRYRDTVTIVLEVRS